MSAPAKARVHRIAVLGGGWAGCAAATQLARAGRDVTLIEASPTLGGRARSLPLPEWGTLDNGQHILLGAYRNTLELMREIGIDSDLAFLRLPVHMCYPNDSGICFRAAKLPAPWHLLAAIWRAQGLSFEDKRALLRFATAARWMGWTLNQDTSVAALLEQFEQSDTLIRYLWAPLCISALNTPIERASAQVFLRVLRDSLGSNRRSSDMLIPRTSLGALLPEPTQRYLLARQSQVRTGLHVNALTPHAQDWTVHTRQAGALHFDAVVLATHASAARRLLPKHPGCEALGKIIPNTFSAILTCYLRYPPNVRLPHPLLALNTAAEIRHFGQFVFDHGHLNTTRAGLLAVVISAPEQHIEHTQLVQDIARQLAHALTHPALATPLDARIVCEKRATFACTPALPRPTPDTPWPTLVLAGDYLDTGYPATLEGAVRSGIQAAQRLLDLAD